MQFLKFSQSNCSETIFLRKPRQLVTIFLLFAFQHYTSFRKKGLSTLSKGIKLQLQTLIKMSANSEIVG